MSEPISADHRQELCDVCREPLVWLEGSTVSQCRHSIRLDDMREEIELPAKPYKLSPETREKASEYEEEDTVDDLAFWLAGREEQLKAALLANREKDAEIARLKEALQRKSTARGEWIKKNEVELLRLPVLEAELAALRAGEKPEDTQALKMILQPRPSHDPY